MKITYDPTKNAKNIQVRGLAFERVVDFEWVTALIEEDIRKPYPERRFQAIGSIGHRLFVVVFTPAQEGIRVISFRKANPREVKHYEQAQP